MADSSGNTQGSGDRQPSPEYRIDRLYEAAFPLSNTYELKGSWTVPPPQFIFPEDEIEPVLKVTVENRTDYDSFEAVLFFIGALEYDPRGLAAWPRPRGQFLKGSQATGHVLSDGDLEFKWKAEVSGNAKRPGEYYHLLCVQVVGIKRSDAPQASKDKVALLLRLLQAKLSTEKAAAAPRPTIDPLVLAIYVARKRLGLAEESGPTIRHGREGGFADAEQIMGPVCDRIDASPLGKSSPLAIGARRVLLAALWKQGAPKRVAAEELVAEIKALIEGMSGGEYEVYVDVKRREIEKVLKAEW
ncbi:hypothetical protein B0T16DRAFT_460477 [Cercophora newfieldiana]|uniref:Uncharacterized protein n=1 Tax=Cercophora newfieldiana TaxID=92897 RepID=A0AA39Y1X7_9PEZI|nr:hypothetical protein B0T16DRAFT_460477 [Cercophora newfieldiana]